MYCNGISFHSECLICFYVRLAQNEIHFGNKFVNRTHLIDRFYSNSFFLSKYSIEWVFVSVFFFKKKLLFFFRGDWGFFFLVSSIPINVAFEFVHSLVDHLQGAGANCLDKTLSFWWIRNTEASNGLQNSWTNIEFKLKIRDGQRRWLLWVDLRANRIDRRDSDATEV